MGADADERRRRAAHAVRVGMIALVAGIALALLPMLLARSSLNKYFVTFGLVGTFVGLGCVTNGMIDWVRGRGR